MNKLKRIVESIKSWINPNQDRLIVYSEFYGYGLKKGQEGSKILVDFYGFSLYDFADEDCFFKDVIVDERDLINA